MHPYMCCVGMYTVEDNRMTKQYTNKVIRLIVQGSCTRIYSTQEFVGCVYQFHPRLKPVKGVPTGPSKLDLKIRLRYKNCRHR